MLIEFPRHALRRAELGAPNNQVDRIAG